MTRRAHIITLEDPVEYIHQNQWSAINQREIGGHTLDFARCQTLCKRIGEVAWPRSN